jgi:3-oxoacyl-[acyl-carrier protein] reductase
LVLLTSGAGIEGSPTGVYGTHKSAIRGLTKSLAREWGPLGVTVNCISPLVITPAVERAFEATTDLEDRMSRMAALHRLGDALEDAGGPFVFLLSDASHFVTGQTLVVDGGRCLQL